jgi:hypothetical protein
MTSILKQAPLIVECVARLAVLTGWAFCCEKGCAMFFSHEEFLAR